MVRKRGFTLVELLVVIAIIAFSLACSCRRCNKPARQRDACPARTI